MRALTAGLDMEMSFSGAAFATLPEALAQGKIDAATLDAAVRRVLEAGGSAGYRAGTAGDIKYALSRSRRGDLNKVLSPRIPESRHHVAIACLRDAHATKLPS